VSRGDDTAVSCRVLIVSSGARGAALRDTLSASSRRFETTILEPGVLTQFDGHYEIALLDADDLAALPDLSPRRPILVVGCDSAEARVAAIDGGATEALELDELSPRTLSRAVHTLAELERTRRDRDEIVRRRELLLRAANDGLWEWELDSAKVRYSDRWCQIVGVARDRADPTPETWFGRVHPDDLRGLQDSLEAHRDGRTPIHEFEHRIRSPEGREHWVRSRALVHRDRWGRAVALAGSLTDINARKAAELNTIDELTGLPSRRVLLERLSQAIDRRRDDGNFRFSVLLLNLNRFRLINDRFGLDAADRILAELAQRLCEAIGAGVLICRYSGDEFVILLEGLDDFAEAEALANRLHETIEGRAFRLDDLDQDIFTSASIGIVNSVRTYASATEVIRFANLAMMRSRRFSLGAATFELPMVQEAVNTHRTQTALREAIDRQQFEVYYQPIVALGSCRLTGFEALVRWNHPNRGVVGPAEFISIAEETGLIISIGQFVLREACTQMATWRRRYPDANDVTISINLSGHQLNSPTIVTDILQVIEDTGLNPKAVKLELTESTLIADSAATRVLGRLRAHGIQLYIDDFGTGYSSLRYLHSFSIDGLKIDKSFVDSLGQEDPRNAAIVPSIIGLAHNLGMGVVAEGVETAEQARELTMLDCAEAQGYLYSRPVPRDEAAKLIERRILCDEDVFK